MIVKANYQCYLYWYNHRVGTQAAYRNGSNYLPYLLRDIDLAQVFSRGVTEGNSLQVTIIDQAGLYTTQALAGLWIGDNCTVEIVCAYKHSDGTVTETTFEQLLVVESARAEVGRITLTLIDQSHLVLDQLYPPYTYQSSDFRDLDIRFAGRAIPYPVGTCYRFDCPQITADTISNQWFHAICEAPLLTLAITAITFDTITVAGNYTDRITAGTILYCNAASANPGRWIVRSAIFSAGNTVITIDDSFSTLTVSGSIVVPPTVTAVHRDGLLVNPDEYTVELIYPASGQIADSDFDNSPVTWGVASSGTGSASLTGGKGRVTGDSNTFNYGELATGNTTPTTLPGSYALATITLDAGSRVRLFGNTLLSGGTVVDGSGTRTVPVKQDRTTGYCRVDITSYNSGFSGTVDVDNLSLNTTKTMLMLRFTQEQVDFDGSLHLIEADVRGVNSRNAASEIKRLIEFAGGTCDIDSFNAAVAYADTHQMLVDVDHGNDGENGQRRVRALLDDLLLIARASLNITGVYGGTPYYTITQDKLSSVGWTFNDKSSPIEVLSIEQPSIPGSIGVRFGPSPHDPAELRYLITRETDTGLSTAAAEPIDVRYIQSATTADRLACYLALKASYSGRIRFKVWHENVLLGDVATIQHSILGTNDWFITRVMQIPGGQECDGEIYYDSIHTYTAGTLPADFYTTDKPDYSHVEPLAPTALKLLATTAVTYADASRRVYISVECRPPSANYAEVWFIVKNNATNEIAALARATITANGTEIVGGLRSNVFKAAAILTDLRANTVYTLGAYALNTTNMQGAIQNTFDATAAGGGATDTTFTTPV